jgi:hypothetical protein
MSNHFDLPYSEKLSELLYSAGIGISLLAAIVTILIHLVIYLASTFSEFPYITEIGAAVIIGVMALVSLMVVWMLER